MGRTTSVVALIATLAAGIALGRLTAADHDPPSTTKTTASSAGATGNADGAQPPAPPRQRAATTSRRWPTDDEGSSPERAAPPDDERTAPTVEASNNDHGPRSLAVCEQDLQQEREQLALVERRRKETEGEPIAARADTPPRFQAAGLVNTFERAFASTKIVGKVESVDCTEHPCILFGRLQGDEEGVATLEDAEPFATYDDDLGVMLTWASADHAHEGATKPGLRREKPPEISLFAFAYYTADDRERHGEMIDRRIRVRTAEYWNSSAVKE